MDLEGEPQNSDVQRTDQAPNVGEINQLSDEVKALGTDEKDVAATDASPTPQEGSKPQSQGRGKKGKKGKRTKYVTLDMASLPDTIPSTRAPAEWQNKQGSSSAWGSGGQLRSGQSQGHSHQGGRSDAGYGESYRGGRQQQSYGSSGQRCSQNQDYGQRDRGSNVALSKAIVTLVRHGKPRDIQLDAGGFALVSDIMQHPQFQRFNLTERGIQNMVRDDNKNRFELVSTDGGGLKIRATQGHSVQLEAHSSGLVPLDPKKHDVIVHGTYQESWRLIKKQGLNRMRRTYIHFAIGYIGETHVTSGMRNTCDITIELDLEKAIKDGLKFYESTNGVVLCEGDSNGSISPKYFKIVKKFDYKSNQFKDMNFQFEEAG